MRVPAIHFDQGGTSLCHLAFKAVTVTSMSAVTCRRCLRILGDDEEGWSTKIPLTPEAIRLNEINCAAMAAVRATPSTSDLPKEK